MNEPPDDFERRIRQLPKAQLPADLKRRVMAAASFAPRAPWRDRVWYSRGWRLAAAGMLVAILVGDRWSSRAVPPRVDEPSALTAAERAAVPALGRELGLTADTAMRLAARAEFAAFTARESAEQAGAALR